MEYYEAKVVMITGAGSGLGLSLVQTLLRVPMDLEWSDSKIYDTIHAAYRCHGPVDILINSAGVGFRGLVAETISEVDRRVMQVDYFGQVSVVKSFLSANREKGSSRCHIIQISSVQGYFGLAERAPYAAAKHALVGFIDSLRSEVDWTIGVSALFLSFHPVILQLITAVMQSLVTVLCMLTAMKQPSGAGHQMRFLPEHCVKRRLARERSYSPISRSSFFSLSGLFFLISVSGYYVIAFRTSDNRHCHAY
jgi:energy-converting hydrogenase Eha subunit E